jgi:sugar lactone lactonase YvrE
VRVAVPFALSSERSQTAMEDMFVSILLSILLLLVQSRNTPGVLAAPDPAQMEDAPPLGYKPVPPGLTLPDGIKLGASSGVVFDANGHMWVLNRGEHPLMEFDGQGKFLRSMGEGKYVRPHGLRIAPDGNIWTTDVQGHTVMQMSPNGDLLLTLGTRGQPGSWDEAAGTRLLFEPADIAFAPDGDVFIVEGHGRGEGRVLRFDKSGKFLKSWGGKGSAPGLFDQPHSILVDAQNQVLVADRENHRVQFFDMDGRFIKSWAFHGLPCGLLVGPDKQLYLATGFSGQILRLNADGKAVAMMGQPGPGAFEFGEAHYIAIAPNTDIYVADTINARLHRFVKQ